ncbi:MAG: histidine kinase [Elainellaceae cyanobacterium]
MAITEKDTRLAPETGAYKRVVGVFKNEEDVEYVIRSLKDSDYDMNRVSLLARNVDGIEGAADLKDRETEGNEAGEGAGIGATTGTVLGGVTGFLIGVGLLAIPGVGPILAAGAEIGALGSTLAGAGIGAATGGIIGALIGLGIPEEKAKVYESRIKAGDYLLMVSGNDDRVNWVESTMRDRHAEELEVFDAPEATVSKDVNRTTEVDVVERDRADATITTGDTAHNSGADVIIKDKR